MAAESANEGPATVNMACPVQQDGPTTLKLQAFINHCGQDVEAKAVFLRVRYLETSDAGELRHSEDYLARYGARGYWLDQLERMRQRPDRYPRASVWAAVAVQAGEHEEAMLWVEKWFDDPWAFASLKVDPTFDSLRSEPRFRALMKKAGLDK